MRAYGPGAAPTMLIAVFAPLLADPEGLQVTKATGGVLEPPSSDYWLGTDETSTARPTTPERLERNSAQFARIRCETSAGAHAGPPGRFARLDYEAEIVAWLLGCFGLATDAQVSKD